MKLLCIYSESDGKLVESVIKDMHEKLTLERETSRRLEGPRDQCRSSV